ncbi:MAG: tRNA glutamyl-Q(34) synthetase GluQRS [Planctomycetes bacterium]|nr:tRNA glutamyl-Q(34) synthetase GluQRS [Planctomycetota bacterium]
MSAGASTGRLAPSPTGRLHLGHARSFLLAWWHARSRGGRMLLRVEDLDRERVKPGYVDGVLLDLAWLGLDWDGAPLLQSVDTSPMQRAVDALLAAGVAYPCVCTRAEVAALSAPHASDDETRYPGTCRGKWRTPDGAEKATGRKSAVRLLVDDGPIEVNDGFLGARAFDVAGSVGDFVVRRRDGAFAYQLAVVVDDARTGVDEIVRGADLLPSAARQKWVQARLALPHPRWWHVPLVVDESGARLAKRRGDLSLASLRESGVDPRAVVAWAARASRQPCEDRVTAAEVLPGFALERVGRDDVVLGSKDVERLLAARA